MDEAVSRQSGASEESTVSSSGGQPWGFWGTTGLGALILAVSVLIRILVAIVLAVPILVEQPDFAVEELFDNGQFLAVSTCATGVLCPLLILFLARVRRRDGRDPDAGAVIETVRRAVRGQ